MTEADYQDLRIGTNQNPPWIRAPFISRTYNWALKLAGASPGRLPEAVGLRRRGKDVPDQTWGSKYVNYTFFWGFKVYKVISYFGPFGSPGQYSMKAMMGFKVLKIWSS